MSQVPFDKNRRWGVRGAPSRAAGREPGAAQRGGRPGGQAWLRPFSLGGHPEFSGCVKFTCFICFKILELSMTWWLRWRLHHYDFEKSSPSCRSEGFYIRGMGDNLMVDVDGCPLILGSYKTRPCVSLSCLMISWVITILQRYTYIIIYLITYIIVYIYIIIYMYTAIHALVTIGYITDNMSFSVCWWLVIGDEPWFIVFVCLFTISIWRYDR